MITKEQALKALRIREILATPINPPINTHSKQREWRVNGQAKTWKRQPEKFQVPIKHGLYNYDYLTDENAHLFEVTLTRSE